MRRRHGAQDGNAAVVSLVAIAICLVVFFMAINLIVDSYGQGVLRTAVDEGAQTGALQGAPGGALGACQAKEAEVMSGLLSGPFAKDVTLGCAVNGDEITATATGSLPGWLPPIPAVSVHVLGTSVLEANPTPTSP